MLRLHLRYLLSRFNIITIIVILLLYLGGLIVSVLSVPKEMTIDVARSVYFYNLVSILKIIVILLIVFLFSLSALTNNDNYQLYILNKRKERIKYYFTKILALTIITIIIISFLFILFVLIGLMFSNWYKIELKHLRFFLYLFLISMMYGLFSYNLIKVLNSLIVILIPCLIIILEEAFMNEQIIKYLSYMFPFIENNDKMVLSYGIVHIIILILCYLLLGLIRSYTLDIK